MPRASRRNAAASLAAACVLSGCLAANAARLPGPIQNVIVVMFENRAFDHYLGAMALNDSRIAGLKPGKQYSNPIDPADPSKGTVPVSFNASFVTPDPCHSVSCMNQQIFGADHNTGVASMDGYAASAAAHHIPPNAAMDVFTPDRVPVLSTLAKEYAMFDDFRCSLPGPTFPNRMMFHAATTNGSCDDCGDIWQCVEGFPAKPLYYHLSNANISWGIYMEEVPDTILFSWMRSAENLAHTHFMGEFKKHLAEGTLPQFSFINPAFYGLGESFPASDQHPSHDVVTGEALMKSIYEDLRGSQYWEQSLLIITYDESGGFWDSSPTPLTGVPSPDGLDCPAPNAFDFQRAGIRIPTVAISPWIARGTVVSQPPPSAKPTPTSFYELTSVYGTLAKVWGLPHMTKRDAWAATFEHLWTNTSAPRKDCLESLPEPPLQEAYAARRAGLAPMHGDAPLNDLQKAFIRLASSVTLPGQSAEEAVLEATAAQALENERLGSLYVRDRMARLMGRSAHENPSHPNHAAYLASVVSADAGLAEDV